MKCKEVRIVIKHRSAFLPAVAIRATDHIKTCPACRDLLLLDKLAPAMIRAASNPDCKVAHSGSSKLLIDKIRSRIQEMREQGASSWELAVEAMRGWLAAFALTAVILIAVSIQWRPSMVTSDFDHEGDELITQNPAEYLISDVPDPTIGQ